jgi:hypothetical protein
VTTNLKLVKEKSTIPGLEKSDFGPPPTPKNRLIWSVFGETKTGKSSFVLSGKEPIAVCDLDVRLERVIDGYIDGSLNNGIPKTIQSMRVQLPKVDPMSRKKDESVLREANIIWDRFLNNYDAALKSSLLPGGIATIGVDTGTELFDLRLLAEFGRLMAINPRDRGGANAEFVEVMRRGEQYDASVVWLHHAKEEWKNSVDDQGREKGSPTGRYILDGFKKANSIVQVVAQTTYNDGARDPRRKFEVTVLRCGVNAALNGKKFTSMDWAVWDDDADKDEPPIINYGPFAYISSLILPHTSPDDWL